MDHLPVPSCNSLALMASARSQKKTFNVETLGQIIYGYVETVHKRRAAWSRVESNTHLETAPPPNTSTPAARTSTSTACVSARQPERIPLRTSTVSSSGSRTLRYTLNNRHVCKNTPANSHPRTTGEMDTPRPTKAYKRPLYPNRARTWLVCPGARKYSDIGSFSDSFVFDSPTISTSRTKFWLGSLAFCYPRGCHSAACYPGGRP